MDRRKFLAFLIMGIAGAGCQASPVARSVSTPDVEEPRVVPTVSFPKPKATISPTPVSRAAMASGLATPVATTYSTLSLPPERIIAPSITLDSKVILLRTQLDRAGSMVWETAPFAVGHHFGSANPGENGNVVLSGHISSPAEGNVFKNLPNLQVGDGIILMTSQQPYLYVVRETKVVNPNAIEVLSPTANPVATLITCVPDGIYTHRLVVRCDAT